MSGDAKDLATLRWDTFHKINTFPVPLPRTAASQLQTFLPILLKLYDSQRAEEGGVNEHPDYADLIVEQVKRIQKTLDDALDRLSANPEYQALRAALDKAGASLRELSPSPPKRQDSPPKW